MTTDEIPDPSEFWGKDCTVRAEFGYRYRRLAAHATLWSDIVRCETREEAQRLKMDFEAEFGSRGEAQALRRVVLETDWSPMEWSSDEPVIEDTEEEHARLPYRQCEWYGALHPSHKPHPYEKDTAAGSDWYWCPGGEQ